MVKKFKFIEVLWLPKAVTKLGLEPSFPVIYPMFSPSPKTFAEQAYNISQWPLNTMHNIKYMESAQLNIC